jgi:NitT/TauT family transport system substrate-binding protein
MSVPSRRAFLRVAASASTISAISAFPRPSTAQDRPVLRIATLPSEVGAAVYYARDLGYFSKAGYDATIQPIPNGAAIVAAVLSGSIDVGFSGNVPLILAHDKGLPVTIIAGAGMHDSKAPTNGMVTVAASSAYRTAKDLNGKTIAVSGLSTLTSLSARVWIDKNGGDSSTIRFVEVPLPQMGPDVLSGRIDAAMMDAAGNEPSKTQFHVLGSSFDAIAPRFLASLWFCSQEWVTKNQAAARAFASAVRSASAWANADPRQAITIYSKNSKYDITELEGAVRPLFATTVTPVLLQSSIDDAAKYSMIKAPFAAKDFIAVI